VRRQRGEPARDHHRVDGKLLERPARGRQRVQRRARQAAVAEGDAAQRKGRRGGERSDAGGAQLGALVDAQLLERPAAPSARAAGRPREPYAIASSSSGAQRSAPSAARRGAVHGPPHASARAAGQRRAVGGRARWAARQRCAISTLTPRASTASRGVREPQARALLRAERAEDEVGGGCERDGVKEPERSGRAGRGARHIGDARSSLRRRPLRAAAATGRGGGRRGHELAHTRERVAGAAGLSTLGGSSRSRSGRLGLRARLDKFRQLGWKGIADARVARCPVHNLLSIVGGAQAPARARSLLGAPQITLFRRAPNGASLTPATPPPARWPRPPGRAPLQPASPAAGSPPPPAAAAPPPPPPPPRAPRPARSSSSSTARSRRFTASAPRAPPHPNLTPSPTSSPSGCSTALTTARAASPARSSSAAPAPRSRRASARAPASRRSRSSTPRPRSSRARAPPGKRPAPRPAARPAPTRRALSASSPTRRPKRSRRASAPAPSTSRSPASASTGSTTSRCAPFLPRVLPRICDACICVSSAPGREAGRLDRPPPC
jgi:hypothetical protein